MNRVKMVVLLMLISALTFAQSKTTEALSKKHEDALSLYFYNNTLRMLNQSEDESFDELIKDIEKMKFLMIDKGKSSFSKDEYKKLLTGYRSEGYEEMMSGRYEGRTFDIYLKEKNGSVLGTVILANDSSNLLVLDILGKIALDKASQLFKTIDENTEIGNKIKAFTGNGDKDKKTKDHVLD